MYQRKFSPGARHFAGTRHRSGGGRSQNRNRQTIDPARFVRAASSAKTEAYLARHTFDDFGLHPQLSRNVARKGFKQPSAIQDQVIPVIMQGRDVVGLANTGTGKTAAFALPLLHKLLDDKTTRALVIAPTRELAQQIESEIRDFAGGCGVSSALLIGGSPMPAQLRILRARPQIIIGTPGRIKDHLERASLKLSEFNTVVLDEVDRMLDMGFIGDIRYLLGKLQQPRQSLFFSATLDSKIESLIKSFSTNPVTISAVISATSDNVDQNVIRHQGPYDKLDKLHDVLISGNATKVLIFDETKRGVERLSKELVARGFKADSLHGDKSQSQRKRALDRFRHSEVNVLVATDVAARGIDVVDISHVINYSLPHTYDDYVHRIGRAGRAGRAGYALTFITQ